eukprot:CAMPEP_0175051466 /NCGR_PEP_ID=MMETSP0052_2-20121109/7817_1 /TAXON_ID=51329 ORGANISM="Polytomella parva, Strain SAG 63-3" /NCGR_SAMPLE_ID=MMETSP0052_2 /ASSEMBLY_ACC=CAM_ASM_000194 /LENGTH=840 /DNA_ID=CAMNT_0016315757 /DNA_START=363 /DNA_END=2885 /DNA_ORIENTATION=+
MALAQSEVRNKFWKEQLEDVKQTPNEFSHFKNHQLPLARIKKIMKSDEDVRMISAEVPILFAKACEFFILELTQRAWLQAEGKRRTLQRNEVVSAIAGNGILDFLEDIVRSEAGNASSSFQIASSSSNALGLGGSEGSTSIIEPISLSPALLPASSTFTSTSESVGSDRQISNLDSETSSSLARTTTESVMTQNGRSGSGGKQSTLLATLTTTNRILGLDKKSNFSIVAGDSMNSAAILHSNSREEKKDEGEEESGVNDGGDGSGKRVGEGRRNNVGAKESKLEMGECNMRRGKETVVRSERSPNSYSRKDDVLMGVINASGVTNCNLSKAKDRIDNNSMSHHHANLFTEKASMEMTQKQVKDEIESTIFPFSIASKQGLFPVDFDPNRQLIPSGTCSNTLAPLPSQLLMQDPNLYTPFQLPPPVLHFNSIDGGDAVMSDYKNDYRNSYNSFVNDVNPSYEQFMLMESHINHHCNNDNSGSIKNNNNSITNNSNIPGNSNLLNNNGAIMYNDSLTISGFNMLTDQRMMTAPPDPERPSVKMPLIMDPNFGPASSCMNLLTTHGSKPEYSSSSFTPSYLSSSHHPEFGFRSGSGSKAFFPVSSLWPPSAKRMSDFGSKSEGNGGPDPLLNVRPTVFVKGDTIPSRSGINGLIDLSDGNPDDFSNARSIDDTNSNNNVTHNPFPSFSHHAPSLPAKDVGYSLGAMNPEPVRAMQSALLSTSARSDVLGNPNHLRDSDNVSGIGNNFYFPRSHSNNISHGFSYIDNNSTMSSGLHTESISNASLMSNQHLQQMHMQIHPNPFNNPVPNFGPIGGNPSFMLNMAMDGPRDIEYYGVHDKVRNEQ